MIQRARSMPVMYMVALLALFVCLCDGQGRPEQIHIAQGQDPSVMTVSWLTLTDDPAPSTCHEEAAVHYGYGESLAYTAYGTVAMMVADKLSKKGKKKGVTTRLSYVHTARITGLYPATRYWYQVGGQNNANCSSGVFNFKTAPAYGEVSFAIFADFGVAMMGESITCLETDVKREAIDLVIHAGDIAYDLFGDMGRDGDTFLNNIEPVASQVAYMVAAGNHEANDGFNQYTQRFRNMPANSGTIFREEFGEAPNSWWYSFNAGLVHFVAISTEVFFIDSPELMARQLAWLEGDLARANADRSAHPWIVVFGHRPLYCSAKLKNCEVEPRVFRPQLANLFYEQGVDLYVSGHSHVYERMFDIAPGDLQNDTYTSGESTMSTVDMPATTFVVSGVAGPDVASDFNFPPLPRTAVRIAGKFGYGRVTVANRTHLLWEQVQCSTAAKEGIVPPNIDEQWLLQN
mmetsp:Transcript_43326/g.102951  ORF Transcript_43326/g.102951 Transcript_43326/m.102951 type:complete len:460 (-) Transcript_43326:6-1385(-)